MCETSTARNNGLMSVAKETFGMRPPYNFPLTSLDVLRRVCNLCTPTDAPALRPKHALVLRTLGWEKQSRKTG
jgi:hypothetical protein